MTYAFIVEQGRRTPIELEAELWRGGEGSVLGVKHRPDQVAKIILKGSSHFPRAKIEAMMASPPEHLQQLVGASSLPMFAWPAAVIEDQKGQATGFVMPRIDRNRAVTLEKYMTRIAAAKALSDEDRSLGRKMHICRNLAAAAAELHRQNHFIVDLKPANVLMFKDTGVVCFIDNDSFSIAAQNGSRFPATAYSQEYLAPELLKGALKPESVINDWQDRFALAVMMFQILNHGIHPFQGAPTIDSEDWNNDFCVRNGYYPYGRTPSQAARPLDASTHDCWDDQTRDLFDRTFTAARPSQRTSAAEWREHFDRMIRGTGKLVRCDRYPSLVTHIHVAGKACQECRFEQLATIIADPPPPPNSSHGISSPLPPPEPGNRKWLYVLAAVVLIIVIGIANAATESEFPRINERDGSRSEGSVSPTVGKSVR